MLACIPWFGTLGLIVGVILGIVQQKRSLWLFGWPFLASECYVALAGSLRGQLPGKLSLLVVCFFLLVQGLLIRYAVRQAQPARWAALALTFFSVSYAMFACFVGGMAFTNSWL